MELSNNLISQFVKATNDTETKKTETTVYGTITVYEGVKYVRIDGSDLLTPIVATTDMINGERVTVTIKDHTAIVTGNIDSPSARYDDMSNLGKKVSEFEVIIADKISVKQLEAEVARITALEAVNVTVTGRLEAAEGKINTLETDNITVNEKLTANDASIKTLEADKVTITNKLEAATADITTLKTDNVTISGKVSANEASIETLEANNATINEKLTANDASIKRLEADKLDASTALITYAKITDLEATNATITNLDAKYANIDFTNIGKAAIQYFYAQSGLIKDVVVGDQTITGELVGVTIKGELIEGGTVVADKLVIKGSGGLYYKLNTDGATTEAEQTEYNSLDGKVITAKSIVATKIDVDDLVAFDATIGGFNITSDSLYSGVKESVDNTTRGIYLDNTGQAAIGDAKNYVKYYKDSDGNYHLDISAATIKLGSTGANVEDTINEATSKVDDLEERANSGEFKGEKGDKGDKGDTGAAGADGKSIGTVTNYYLATNSSSGVTTSTSGWTTTVQSVSSSKKYLWNYEVIKYSDGTVASTSSPCIIGAYGDTGSTGATGDTGNGVSSITEYYAVSSSNSTAPTSWSTTVPTMTSTNKYLWNYETVTYTNGSTENTAKRVIGVYGDKGNSGNLVKNGYGEYLNATNLSAGTFTRGDCPDEAYGYFYRATFNDPIKIDKSKIYDVSYYCRLHEGRSGTEYFSIVPYDVDGNLINWVNTPCGNVQSDLFYLSQDINNGDTVLYFTDLSAWKTITTTQNQRRLALFGYTDSTGYTYPDGEYTRHIAYDMYEDSGVDIENNTITLNSAWSMGTFKAGTAVMRRAGGSTFIYCGQNGALTNTEWKKWEGCHFTAIVGENGHDSRLAYAHTVIVKPNYSGNGDFCAIDIREQTIDNVAREKAEAAQETADSKTDPDKIIETINNTPETVKIEGEHINITGLVSFDSFDSSLQSRVNTIQSTANTAATNASNAQTVLGNWCYNNDKTVINGGKIYTGTIGTSQLAASAVTADKIAAKAVTADKISVTDLYALGATIGGLHITSGTIYSGSKSSISSTSQGLFMDSSGQLNVGNSTNYIKFASGALDLKVNSLTIGTSDVATAITNAAYWKYDKWIDATSYDESLWIPFVSSNSMTTTANTYINVTAALGMASGTKPSWAAHNNGFSVNFLVETQPSAWGTQTVSPIILQDTWKYCASSPVSFKNNHYTSYPILYLRGGGKYRIRATYSPGSWTAYPDGYTWTSGSYSKEFPTSTTRPDYDGEPYGTKSQVDSAAKTATNYLKYDSSGLVVGNMTASTLGNNVLIDSDSVDIRNGTTVLASYSANTIYLGKNSTSSTIDLSNGSAKMIATTATDFKIYTDRRLVMSAYRSALIDCYRASDAYSRIAVQSYDPSDLSFIGSIALSTRSPDLLSEIAVGTRGIGIGCGPDEYDDGADVNIDMTYYEDASGSIKVRAPEVEFYINGNTSSLFTPYYRAGNSITFAGFDTAGYITTSSKNIHFTIPLANPIIGNPTVTVTSVLGLVIRQNNNYLCGSSGSGTYAKPSSYSARIIGKGDYGASDMVESNAIQITAVMSDTTNVTNNSACGIYAYIKVTFS